MTTLCVVAAACILIAGLFAVIVERTNERDDARGERDSALAQIAELLAEVDRFGELTDTLAGDALTLAAQLREANTRAWDAEHVPLADVVPIEGLRVVPEQRTPVADGHFPIHTEIHDHDIEALMRATEEN